MNCYKKGENLLSSGLSSKVDSPNLNIIDSVFVAFRQGNREHLHPIWRRAQDGQLEGLGDEERRLAEIMLAHPTNILINLNLRMSWQIVSSIPKAKSIRSCMLRSMLS